MTVNRNWAIKVSPGSSFTWWCITDGVIRYLDVLDHYIEQQDQQGLHRRIQQGDRHRKDRAQGGADVGDDVQPGQEGVGSHRHPK